MDTHKDLSKITTACLTGHRPKSLPWKYDETKEDCQKFKQKCKEIFVGAINYGITTFLTGMAEGFNMIAAEIILEIKKDIPHVKLIAVIPCNGQEIRWTKSQQKRYREILKQCDEKIVLSENYNSTCMNNRNLYMVQNSSICIACWSGKPSGTKNTIIYAKENGCKVKIINPENF